MLSRKLSALQEQSIQNTIYSATGGATALMVGVIGGWFSLFSDIALLTIMGGGLFLLDSTLTALILLFYGVIALSLHRLIAERLRNLGGIQAQLGVAIGERISEVYLAYREIFVRNRRSFYADYISKANFSSAAGNALITLTSMTSKYVFELGFVCGSLAVAGYAFLSRPVSSAVGILAIFLASSMRIVPALLRIQQGVATIRLQTGYAKPTLELMQRVEHLETINEEIVPFSRHHGSFLPEIHVSNLLFKYDISSDWELKVDDLKVSNGEFIAIVGSSGAGKTTLVDLILGLREPMAGKIEVSNISPDKAITKFPGAISYLPQDAAIFPGTIRRNLCIGFDENEISEKYLWEALEKAKLDSYVRNLPDGLETEVGERGTRLSGGQRQRLGLARAFVSLPKLIILDEATSMLDAEVESAISESIQEMAGQITLVVIAHRLSTVRRADRLYFLRDGTIVDSGNFEELREKVPDFARQASLMGL